jgi:hypothetical protein
MLLLRGGNRFCESEYGWGCFTRLYFLEPLFSSASAAAFLESAAAAAASTRF